MSHPVRLVVDAQTHEVAVQGHDNLLTLLRDHLGLTATKDACEEGRCGSCSVWLDGAIVCSCLVAAIQADGAEVRTVASSDDGVAAVQEALVQGGAIQCGFCTPGLVVAAADLLRRSPSPTDEDLTEALEGNLCRCTGYTKIVEAVRATISARHD